MEMDLEILACFCDEAQDLLVRWEALCLEMGKETQAGQYDELFRLAHNLKGSSRAVGLDAFGNFVHKVEDGITDLKTGAVALNPNILRALLKAQEILFNWIGELKTNPEHPMDVESFLASFKEAFAANAQSEGSFETQIQAEMQVTEVMNAPEAELSFSPEPAKIAAEKPKAKPPAPEKAVDKKNNIDETVRVSARKIEQLIEMMGELSIHQAVVSHSITEVKEVSAQLQHSAYLSRKITRELYEKTLALRMVPVQPVFQRMERNIREMASTLGKQVDVEVIGGEVELDKTVCEKIVEPLTHMVRNSVDHGLEKSEDRVAAGKDPIGKVKLTAVQDSGSVYLWIEDDGRGLNVEKIRAKALANGIIKEDTVLDPSEVFALIFLPGFSTAEKVTDVSGRGVGMDVVMKTVESLKGEIKIGSEVGKGTQFRIALPTTLSIIDALIVNLRGTDYAVPISAIDEIVHMSETNLQETDRMFSLHEKVLPICALAEALNLKADAKANKHHSMLISKVGKEKVAFKVDQIGEQQQVVVRKFANGMEKVFGLAGGTILGNGQPGLIIDLRALTEHQIQLTQPKNERAA